MSTTSGKKPVRRVRVIEIVDEDDTGAELDEATVRAVLAAADAEEAAEAEAAAGKAAETDDVELDDIEEMEAPEKAEASEKAEALEKAEEPAKAPAEKKGSGGDTKASGRLVQILSAAVAVLAVLAAVGLFQWRSAAAADADRAELVKRIAAFGDVMATFSYADVQAANHKTLSYLTGDARTEREKLDLAEFGKRLTAQKADLTSKTYAVYVGSVDGMMASAVLVFDLSIEAPALSQSQTISRSHLTLGLIKVDGTWMISSMVPAGSESATGTAVPGVEGATETPAPVPSAPADTESPKAGD
ncbi:hypothetical protein EDD29_7453 [Actinocorallia herbida]|uniref:Mce-associated membrane protein n=1 Tax=Actinocorallia herbida TaxID=58109 RepID=A0A3N1D8D7_9ACTN|nr:hypothetical protein [Actinocorallia herbida]ROO89746.1 hypothetical protein EDD29_7453 [Actinocorallia herbida]